MSGGQAALSVPAGGTGTATLGVISPGVCQLPGAVLFATASSFVEPGADNQAALREIVAFAAGGNLHNQLLIVGHTDTSGDAASNDALSQRRADGVHALLTGDAAAWEQLFVSERWSTTELTHLVVTTGEADPGNPAAVAAAVARHEGAANAPARALLYPRYFDALLGRLGPPTITFVTRTPPHLGCGESHPLRGAAASPSRDPSLPPITGDFGPNRRTEAFFFTSSSPSMTCSDYPTWTLSCTLPAPALPVIDWFVSISLGTDAPGHGSSRTGPFRTINFAIDHVAALPTPARNVIHVMAGTYAEAIMLASNVDLVADSGASPLLTWSAPGTIVTCDGVQDVRLEGLAINGSATEGSGPAGIVIRASRNVSVITCRVTRCVATRGGGILVEESDQVTVVKCDVSDNQAGRGGGIAMINAGQVTVDNCILDRNTAGTNATALTTLALDGSITTLEVTRFEYEAGDAHGGGLYLEDCDDAKVLKCQVRENTAILFGGGIAVDNQPGFVGPVLIEGNTITCNQVAHADVAVLAAPAATCQRADMGDPISALLARETIPVFLPTRAVRYLHGVGRESGLGGGVALRHVTSSTRLVDNQIGAPGQPNLARRGGGVACFVGAYPLLERNRIDSNLSSDDGAGVVIDQFDPFLPRGQDTFLGFARVAMVPRQPVRLVNNQITANRTREDGGGLYATGAVIVEITGAFTVFADNRANENGGGVRVSYASRLTVRGATFRGNRANTDAFERQGGGAVAARNSFVELDGCTFVNNRVDAFAGGAVYVNSSFEGGFDEGGFNENVHGQFDLLQEQDYLFRTRHLIVRNCVASGNVATGPLPGRSSGAGGFLYTVRVPGNDGGVEPLEVRIEGSGTAIGVNWSDFEKTGIPGGDRRKRGNVVIELSGEKDGRGLPRDRVNISGDVKAIPAGIASSTPVPDIRAVAVLHEASAPGTRGDDLDPAFPYANVVLQLTGTLPAFGPQPGGQLIAVMGEGFVEAPGMEVRLAGEPVTIIDVLSSREIVVTTPEQAPPGVPGPVDVTVLNGDGQSAVLVLGYEYALPPTAISVAPTAGTITGGDRVAVSGSDFRADPTVLFGGVPADVISVTDQEIAVSTPPQFSSGNLDVEVRNADGQSSTIPLGFEYRSP